jgi:hypothetical protein
LQLAARLGHRTRILSFSRAMESIVPRLAGEADPGR